MELVRDVRKCGIILGSGQGKPYTQHLVCHGFPLNGECRGVIIREIRTQERMNFGL